MLFSGKVELRRFGAVPSDSVFLGTSMPLAAAAQKTLRDTGHTHASAILNFPDGWWEAGKGELDVRCQVLGGSGSGASVEVVEVFKVGELDIIAALREFPGARAEVRLTTWR